LSPRLYNHFVNFEIFSNERNIMDMQNFNANQKQNI
jgi:hypothetical protein